MDSNASACFAQFVGILAAMSVLWVFGFWLNAAFCEKVGITKLAHSASDYMGAKAKQATPSTDLYTIISKTAKQMGIPEDVLHTMLSEGRLTIEGVDARPTGEAEPKEAPISRPREDDGAAALYR